MTNQASRNEEMTDVFLAERENLSKLPKKEFKLSQQKLYIIGTAAVLLGGSAFAFKTYAEDDTKNEPNLSKPDINLTENYTNVVTADSTKVDKPVQPIGTIKPNETIDIAHNVNDKMSFGEAFASARDEVGTGGLFTWNGHSYSTFVKEEWQSMSLVQRNDFLADVGYEQRSSNEAVSSEPETVVNPTITEQPIDSDQIQEPSIKFTSIDGKEAIAVDEDNDGLVDSIVVIDENGGYYAIFNSREIDGSNELDTVAILDPFTLEVKNAKPLEETFELAMINLADSPFLENDGEVVDSTEVNEEDSIKTEETNEEEAVEEEEAILDNDNENYDNEADVTEMI